MLRVIHTPSATTDWVLIVSQLIKAQIPNPILDSTFLDHSRLQLSLVVFPGNWLWDRYFLRGSLLAVLSETTPVRMKEVGLDRRGYIVMQFNRDLIWVTLLSCPQLKQCGLSQRRQYILSEAASSADGRALALSHHQATVLTAGKWFFVPAEGYLCSVVWHLLKSLSAHTSPTYKNTLIQP